MQIFTKTDLEKGKCSIFDYINQSDGNDALEVVSNNQSVAAAPPELKRKKLISPLAVFSTAFILAILSGVIFYTATNVGSSSQVARNDYVDQQSAQMDEAMSRLKAIQADRVNYPDGKESVSDAKFRTEVIKLKTFPVNLTEKFTKDIDKILKNTDRRATATSIPGKSEIVVTGTSAQLDEVKTLIELLDGK